MADGITDEMIEIAAQALCAAGATADDPDQIWTLITEGERAVFREITRAALTAGLAGRAVVDLPAPEIRPRKQRSWFVAGYEITAHVAYTGDAMVDDDDRIMSAGHAEDHGLALIAAAREARQLAIEVADEASADVAGGGVL